MSLPELFSLLEAQNKKIYDDRRFFAAIQGIDLDKNQAPQKSSTDNKSHIERVKERIAKRTGQPVRDANDITNFTGQRAKEAGFGIGMGIDYEVVS